MRIYEVIHVGMVVMALAGGVIQGVEEMGVVQPNRYLAKEWKKKAEDEIIRKAQQMIENGKTLYGDLTDESILTPEQCGMLCRIKNEQSQELLEQLLNINKGQDRRKRRTVLHISRKTTLRQSQSTQQSQNYSDEDKRVLEKAQGVLQNKGSLDDLSWEDCSVLHRITTETARKLSTKLGENQKKDSFSEEDYDILLQHLETKEVGEGVSTLLLKTKEDNPKVNEIWDEYIRQECLENEKDHSNKLTLTNKQHEKARAEMGKVQPSLEIDGTIRINKPFLKESDQPESLKPELQDQHPLPSILEENQIGEQRQIQNEKESGLLPSHIQENIPKSLQMKFIVKDLLQFPTRRPIFSSIVTLLTFGTVYVKWAAPKVRARGQATKSKKKNTFLLLAGLDGTAWRALLPRMSMHKKMRAPEAG